MSNDNTRDAAEPSLASAGSHGSPVAWVAFAADASESRALFLTRDAAERAARKHGWFVAELFARPTLTDDEREAFKLASEWCRAYGGAVYDAGHAIERFLERRVVAERNADIERLTAEVERLRLTPSEQEAINAIVMFAEEHLGSDDPCVVALAELRDRYGGGE